MCRNGWVFGGVLLCALMVGAATSAQEKHESHGGDENASAMMEMWMALAAPGEHHGHLAVFEGSWTSATKWRMSADAPWTESTGASRYRMIMGGRYLEHQVKGVIDGMPFEGRGIMGYDNGQKKYVSIWLDNMSTMIMTSSGSCDQSGKVFTMTGDYFDPMTKGMKSSKTVIRVINADKHTMEMYDKTPDGKEFVSLEVTYTRK